MRAPARACPKQPACCSPPRLPPLGSHFKAKLAKETIVHIWKSVTNVTEVLADGYNVLLNVGYDASSWYLDNLNVRCGCAHCC